jgi:hypothetical protein
MKEEENTMAPRWRLEWGGEQDHQHHTNLSTTPRIRCFLAYLKNKI